MLFRPFTQKETSMTGRIIPDVVNNQTIQTLTPKDTVRDAAQLMGTRRISAILISEEDKLLGIVTERDLTAKVLAASMDPDNTSLAEIMTKDPHVIGPNDSPLDALELMRMRGFRHLPVVDNEQVVGMVSIRDLYAAAKDQLEEDVRQREAFIFDTGYGTGA